MEEIKIIIDVNKLNCTVKDFIDNVNDVQNKVNWYYICLHYNLSESFIEKFQHKVDWHWVSEKNLSESFLKKFQDKIYFDWILEFNEKIPIKTIKNKYTSYHQIHKNINVYKDTLKNKRYLFLKNINYKELNKLLITFKKEN